VLRYDTRRIVRAGRVAGTVRCKGAFASVNGCRASSPAVRSPPFTPLRIVLPVHYLVKAAEIDLNFDTCIPASLTPSFRRSVAWPILFQSVLPMDHLRAYCTFISSALTVGCSSRM